MRIAMIGAGYVGLVSGACFAEFGASVICVDKAPDRIEALVAGKVPIYEPGLDDLIHRNVDAGRLTFTTDLASAVSTAEAIFIAVGTPSRRGDGHADLSYVFAAAREIAASAKNGAVIVTKSTVPVGTGRMVADILTEIRPDAGFHIASNPEFLREGSAISDFMRPDRVILGVENEAARTLLKALYRPLQLSKSALVSVDLETAELIKYASNAFLATKIAFINEMADVAEAVGADIAGVALGMGLDGRIGAQFLQPGPGYGGSCFPKDTKALAETARAVGRPATIIDSVILANARRRLRMAEKVIDLCGGSLDGQRVACFGVTFKAETDDLRDAPALEILPALQEAGAMISAYDPQGMEEASTILPGITWADTPYAAVEGADCIVVLTEWNEFRAVDLQRLKSLMRTPRIADFRNLYDPTAVRAAGFAYDGVGRGTIST
ncbi:MAG: UDP-glucose dehydrogenase family protein [Alphaproteobacteria bacterium]